MWVASAKTSNICCNTIYLHAVGRAWVPPSLTDACLVQHVDSQGHYFACWLCVVSSVQPKSVHSHALVPIMQCNRQLPTPQGCEGCAVSAVF